MVDRLAEAPAPDFSARLIRDEAARHAREVGMDTPAPTAPAELLPEALAAAWKNEATTAAAIAATLSQKVNEVPPVGRRARCDRWSPAGPRTRVGDGL